MTRLGVEQSRLPAGRRGARSEAGAGRAICSTPTIAGIEKADALLIVGSNPRREAAVLNARIRKRWRTGKFPIGLIGEQRRSDLSPTTISAPGRETLAEIAAGRHDFAERCARPSGRWSSSGRARWRAPDGAAIAALAAQAPRDIGAVKDGWNGFSRAAHGGLARRRARSRFRARAGRPERRRRWRRPARSMSLFLLGADEIDVAPGRFRRLYRHPWRPRRASRRCHPAGRRLSGKIRHLRQHRRPRADGRRAPRSRPATRARTGRSCARSRTCSASRLALRLARAAAAGAVQGASASAAHRSRSRRATRPTCREACRRAAATPDKAPFASAIEDFYLTNPIARASAVMAECSAIAEGSAALTAAE